jgi:hypothetical protein
VRRILTGTDNDKKTVFLINIALAVGIISNFATKSEPKMLVS